MKRIGLALLSISLALPSLATAADRDRGQRQSARYDAAVARMVARSRPPAQARAPMPRPQRPISGMSQQRSFRAQQQFRANRRMMDPDVSVGSRTGDRPFSGRMADLHRPRERQVAPRIPAISTAAVEQNTTVTQPRTTNRTGGRDWRNREGRGGDRDWRNHGSGDRDWRNREGDRDGRRGHGRWRNRNYDERHRNWHDRHDRNDPNYRNEHRRWHRREHDRAWWRRNYNRFVLFGGGYYYWNSGYWYPAYGYDPYYNTYAYDAPIYSFNGLTPTQVIARAQARLQERGYYNAAVDGTYGPMTRQALMNYQADHGLPMTGEIDQATLNSLEMG